MKESKFTFPTQIPYTTGYPEQITTPSRLEEFSIDDAVVRVANEKKKKARREKCRTCVINTLVVLVTIAVISGGFTFGVLMNSTEVIFPDTQCVYHNTTCDDNGVRIFFEVGIRSKYVLLPEYPDLNTCMYRCCVKRYYANHLYKCRVSKDYTITKVVDANTPLLCSIFWWVFGLPFWCLLPVCMCGKKIGCIVSQ